MRKEKRNLVLTEIFMIVIAIIWFIPIYYLIVTTRYHIVKDIGVI